MPLVCAPPPPRLGPYELLEKIATGGMAEIYVARRVGPHGFAKRIALKRILPQLAADAEFVAMFIDEARVCAQLAHPNLVQVFDFGEQGDELYMAMELVEGTTAAKVVRAAAAKSDPVPLEVALHIGLSVGRGLVYAHEACDEGGRSLGLVHRDVSPGNILISRSGAVKLGDFGIARAADFERRTEHGQLKGKLGYMSPEQVTGQELDAKSDQFTLGIVLSELLTARPLFSATTEMDILVKIRDADLSTLHRYGTHIPEDVRSVLLRALARRPQERFNTTAAFVDALEEIVRRRRLDVRPAGAVDWLSRAGLIKPLTRSGEHPVPDLEDTRPRHPPVPPPLPQHRIAKGQVPPAPWPAPGAPNESGERPKPSRQLVPEAQTPGAVAPAIYRVEGVEGRGGPVSYPVIAELFATARVFGHTPVAREQGSFRPARDYPELERLCSTLATRWDDEVGQGATERWQIRPGEWPGQLVDLALGRVTGVVLVRSAARQKKIFFVDGVPEYTASTDAKELLGTFLVDKGLALPMEVEMALALAPRYGGRLGDALVGLGVLRPMELVRAVVDQVRARFLELVRWKQGEVIYIAGARSHEETLPEAFPAFELIARGILEGYGREDLAALLTPIEDDLIVPVARPPVSITTLRLPDPETAVFDRITGDRTLQEVVLESIGRGIADRYEALRAVFIGLSIRVLVARRWPPSQSRPSMPTLPVH
jgi:eukaryotic-like serine/threonine-protein kinase